VLTVPGSCGAARRGSGRPRRRRGARQVTSPR
jgi:hypothetical protein